MGHSNGTAAGMTFGNDRKIVSFIGDSTFFHAGLPAIINAVVYDHDFTLVVMENGTTAMTGHQPHPGSGDISDKIPIRRVLEALGVGFIREVDAYAQKPLQQAMKEAMDHEGFAVVIAKHPCMLKFTREQRKKGKFAPTPMKVWENCDRSYVCLSDFACPSFIRNEDGSVSVNEELCIGDGSCMAVCPASALKFPDAKE
jgi:indolepyruvate ferredoxin oxidoreductase alpha subunit